MAQTFSICSQVGANTGGIDCDVTKGLPVQLVLGSAAFTPTDYATDAAFEAAFLAKLIEPAGSSDKLFPFPVIQGNTAKTTAAKYGTLGYGLEVKLLRSKPGYEFDVLAGSDLERKLIAFDGQIVQVFIFDNHSNLWGVFDSGKNFKGAKYLVGVEPKDFEDAQNPKTTKITISIIDSRDFVENAKYAHTSFNSSDIVGLNDVELYEAVVSVTNVRHIGAKIGTSSILSFLNVADTYTAELGVTALWSAMTGVNFATVLAITSVVYDAANKCWTLTLDTTAYAALPAGAKIEINLVSPVALNAAHITGIEAGALIIAKP